MFRRWCVLALVSLAMTVPSTAHAEAAWSWPVDGDPALAYGARYTDASGRSCTHGGLDISAGAGETVRACSEGEVVFAGLVPAGEGARAYAVTVLTADGLRVTYLPLGSVGVHKGQAVEGGHALGALAGSGDASAPGAHLHLGVKRGGRALDPMSFLAARPAAAPQATTAPAATSSKSGRVHVSASAPSAAPAAAGASAPVARVSAGAPAVSSAASPATVLRDALSSLTQAPPIARAEPIAAPAVVSLSRIGSDMSASRALLVSWATRIGLILLSCAAVWPVLRKARAAGAVAAAEPEMRRAR